MKRIEISADRSKSVSTAAQQSRISLHGITILAFGGAGTIGTAFSAAAAASGATLVIADAIPQGDEAQELLVERLAPVAATAAAAGGRSSVPFLDCDITKPDDVAEAVQAAASIGGTLDIVIDFAGVHHAPFDLSREAPEELLREFRRVLEVNLTGAFSVTVAAARQMLPQRRGHIIHLCSNGSRAALYGSYAYNASKHGVEGVVKTAAAQLAPYGVRVNAIAPGTVETSLNRDLLRDEEGIPKPRAKSILAHTPTKRFATADGVAKTLLAMCLEQPHFTGNVVFADDGYNIEGHSWPEGNEALYGNKLEQLLGEIAEPPA